MQLPYIAYILYKRRLSSGGVLTPPQCLVEGKAMYLLLMEDRSITAPSYEIKEHYNIRNEK